MVSRHGKTTQADSLGAARVSVVCPWLSACCRCMLACLQSRWCTPRLSPIAACVLRTHALSCSCVCVCSCGRCSLYICCDPASYHTACMTAELAWLHVERVWHHEPHGIMHHDHGAAHTAHTAHSRPGSKQSSSSSSSNSAAFASTEGQPEERPLRAKRLVVSMASFPGRAEFAAPTVYSIMQGTRKPDALYFWVSVNVSR
jgi:hypothetical protein